MKMVNEIMILFSVIILSSNAYAIDYGGVEFPDGPYSFADSVVSYSPGPDARTSVQGTWNNPAAALGVPDNGVRSGVGVVSLGDNGVLILEFTDNSLTTSGDSNKDLWIFEVGGEVEAFNVAISKDNIDWIDLGNISGQPTGIDIDAVGAISSAPEDIDKRRECVHPSKLKKVIPDEPSEPIDGSWDPAEGTWYPLEDAWGEWDQLKNFTSSMQLHDPIPVPFPGGVLMFQDPTIQAMDVYGQNKLNVDQYEITIDSKGDDPRTFFKEFRLNLPDLIFNEDSSYSLSGYVSAEMNKWNSTAPLGALMTFELAPLLEDGSVFVSCIDELSFIFSTVKTVADAWHPVSGNRGFGLKINKDGSFTIFTKGADRVTSSSLASWGPDELVFKLGDDVWRELLVNIRDQYSDRNPREMRKISN